MFMPNYKLIDRFADCRLNGMKDEAFEQGLSGGDYDYYIKASLNNQKQRENNVIAEITQDNSNLTNVDEYGDRNKYINAMRNNLSNYEPYCACQAALDELDDYSDDDDYKPAKKEKFDKKRQQKQKKQRETINNYPIYPMYPSNKIVLDKNKTIIVAAIVIVCVFIFVLIGFGIKNNNIEKRLREHELRLNNRNYYREPPVIVQQPVQSQQLEHEQVSGGDNKFTVPF